MYMLSRAALILPAAHLGEVYAGRAVVVDEGEEVRYRVLHRLLGTCESYVQTAKDEKRRKRKGPEERPRDGEEPAVEKGEEQTVKIDSKTASAKKSIAPAGTEALEVHDREPKEGLVHFPSARTIARSPGAHTHLLSPFPPGRP